jgi:hypothetical protein
MAFILPPTTLGVESAGLRGLRRSGRSPRWLLVECVLDEFEQALARHLAIPRATAMAIGMNDQHPQAGEARA